MSIYKYFLVFIFYSFLGWLMEVILTYSSDKKFVNRGFLIGPYCPIYGWGVLLIMFILKRYLDRPIGLFCMAVIICSVLEYLTSYLMEKLFKARWWDYSNKKYNIEGRICLSYAICFGIGGTLIMYFINPVIIHLINIMPSIVIKIIAIVLFIIFIADNILSYTIMFKFRTTVGNLAQGDNTEEITKMIKDKFKSVSWFNKRLTEAFPKLKTSIDKAKVKRKLLSRE